MMQDGANQKMRLAKKKVSVNETEISVAVIPVKEIKDEAESKSRKFNRELLVDFQAGIKYHKSYYTNKKSLMKRRAKIS